MLLVQLQSSSSDEAINTNTEKLSEEEEPATASSRTSVEVEEEALEKVKKAQQKIKLVADNVVNYCTIISLSLSLFLSLSPLTLTGS